MEDNSKEYRAQLLDEMRNIKILNTRLFDELIKSNNEDLNAMMQDFINKAIEVNPFFNCYISRYFIKEEFDKYLFKKYEVEIPVRSTDQNYLLTSVKKDYPYVMSYYTLLNELYTNELLLTLNSKHLTKIKNSL